MFGLSTLVPRLELYGVILAVILAVLGAAYAYYSWSSAKIDALSAEVNIQKSRADTLDLTVKTMQADMQKIKVATDQANAQINAARNKASTTAVAIRSQNFVAPDHNASAALTAKVNTDVDGLFKGLQDVTKK